jgi:Xaa-Pro aminopeptidase
MRGSPADADTRQRSCQSRRSRARASVGGNRLVGDGRRPYAARMTPRSLAAFTLLLVAAPAPLRADPAADTRERPAPTTPFPPDVYRARRAKLMALMKKGVGFLLSDTKNDPDGQGLFDFFYLTGIDDEHNAALALVPENVPEERERLFLPTARPEPDRYSGYRAILPSRAVEQRVGFANIGHIEGFGAWLAQTLSHVKLLHYFGAAIGYDDEPSKMLEVAEKATKHVLGSRLEDSHLLLGKLRMVKEPREVEKIQKATDITVAGHLEAMRRMRPGMREWELKQIVEDTFRKGGARKLSYPSIVGGGPDGCVLHYPEDDRVVEDGELVLIDAGAEYDHYATDVTRTFPANGKFTPEQRKIYETVLQAQNAALAKVRPGVTWGELQRTAQKVISDAGYYDYFIHGLGHHVGLQVHDLGVWSIFEPIAEGSVITIEPGIYIPQKKLGVRIEDTILVTKSGPKLLSGALPRDPDEIERLMKSARR